MPDDEQFDFQAHERSAVLDYLSRHRFYGEVAMVLKRIIEESLKGGDIKVQSVDGRAKEPESFGRKAATPSDIDPSKPKYPRPLEQITDMVGIRVIAFFPDSLAEIDTVLAKEFTVLERSDKAAELLEEERFGYHSIHYLVRLSPQRAALHEYKAYADTVVEVQVRTILQHAWAEIEHDIQYKSTAVIPAEIRRRFIALAGMLEIADREFQAIQDADRRLAAEARTRVAEGRLADVEITLDALQAFLDKRLGPDDRISDFSYHWTARLLSKLGFKTLQQVEECIQGYDADQLSRIASGRRQGQLSRFEYLLLAGMGETFIARHHYGSELWFPARPRAELAKFKQQGIEIRNYDPLAPMPMTREGDS